MAKKKELIIHIGGNAINFSRVARGVKGTIASIGKVGHAVGGVLRKAFKWGAVGLGALSGVAVASVRAFMKDDDALQRLRARLAELGPALGLAEEQFKEFAKQMQETTIFADDDVMAMQAVLATFNSIKGDTFLRASKDILHMSAALHGAKASGESLEGEAIKIGKALENPIQGLGMLSKVGITFTEAQKKIITGMVKAGNLEGAQAMMLDRLEGKYGSMATTLRGSLSGAFRYMRNQFDGVLEGIGEGIVVGGRLTDRMNSLGAKMRDFGLDLGARIAPQVERFATALENIFGDSAEREKGKAELLAMFDDLKVAVKPVLTDWGSAMGTAAANAFKAAVAQGTNSYARRVTGSKMQRGMTIANPMTSAIAGASGAMGYFNSERSMGRGLLSSAGGASLEYWRQFGSAITGTQGRGVVKVQVVNSGDFKAQ